VDGGIVQISDSQTGTTGEALASIVPQAPTVNIVATISGQWYSSSTITKSVTINPDETTIFAQEQPTTPDYSIKIFGIDPVLIIVPGAIGAAGFMLKRKGQLKIKN
ncbi:MAG: hypothetical protein HZC29_05080, partial [Thaumarchaeota archaeon]|nr:hypothetical protein [Nitrososphaerota archaeon]